MRALILLAATALATTSCIKSDLDAECPGQVQIAVRDKNYDNAAQVGDVVAADNLPVSAYLASLVSRNHPQNSTLYAARQEPLTDAQLTYPVPGERFARGMNDFSAVGRSLDAALAYSADQTPFTLHAGGAEGEDTYLGGDRVKFPMSADQTVWMLRTKGKLMVDAVGVPAAVSQVKLSVGSLYATAAEQLSDETEEQRIKYAGSTAVSRTYTSAGATGLYQLKLAPSAATTSPLTVSFLDAAGAALHTLTADITVRRNHITRIRAEYVENRDGEGGLWTLTVNVDGRWVKVEEMTIE